MNLEVPEQRYRAQSHFVGSIQYVVGWLPVDTAAEIELIEVALAPVVVVEEVVVEVSVADPVVAGGVAVGAISIAVLAGAEVAFVLVDASISSAVPLAADWER